ncbi:MAG: nucleotidyl transferase AbiEii/AbiGii toxin family protein [Chloroflexota bacterium]
MATLIQTLQQVLESKDPALLAETRRILLKEALQAIVLDYLYNHPHYRLLNFYGGTCLHVVYGLNRLSEDLDLDNGRGLDLSRLGNDLGALFQGAWGYDALTTASQHGESRILRILLKFPLLNRLGLSPHPEEALHLKLEISQHRQVAVIQNTPVFYYGHSFVPAHFSLETMMAGKILACLERSFQRGKAEVWVKGRDFYDLLWFMQQGVRPLEQKLARDGQKPYTLWTAMQALREKVAGLRTNDLATDLLPMFESRTFIEAWLEGFHTNFERFAEGYLGQTS